jgi:hypothetical protein
MLDRLAGAADLTHKCGYEEAVLEGPSARVSGISAGGGIGSRRSGSSGASASGDSGGNGGSNDSGARTKAGADTTIQDLANGCCASVAAAKDALDNVDLVTWGITSGNVGNPGSFAYNQTEDEPFTLDAAVLHAVLDGVARAIEEIQTSC